MLEAVNLIQGDYIVAPLYSQNTAFVYNSAKLSDVVFDKSGQFTVKDFKECRCRVAVNIGAHLINLIKKHHGIK